MYGCVGMPACASTDLFVIMVTDANTDVGIGVPQFVFVYRCPGAREPRALARRRYCTAMFVRLFAIRTGIGTGVIISTGNGNGISNIRHPPTAPPPISGNLPPPPTITWLIMFLLPIYPFPSVEFNSVWPELWIASFAPKPRSRRSLC